jgi:hypothetical protein
MTENREGKQEAGANTLETEDLTPTSGFDDREPNTRIYVHMPCNDGLMAAAVYLADPERWHLFRKNCQSLTIVDPYPTNDLRKAFYDMINGIEQMIPPASTRGATICPYIHGKTVLDDSHIRDRHLVFIDCRPTDQDIERVVHFAKSTVILDHHPFADPKMNSGVYLERMRRQKANSEFYYSNVHCGSMLAWMRYCAPHKPPPLLQSVDRYDRGVGTQQDVSIAEALKCLTKSVDDAGKFLYLLAASYDEQVMSCLVRWGEAIVFQREAIVEKLVQRTVKFTRHERYTVVQAQSDDATSAGHTLHTLKEWYPYADIFAAYYYDSTSNSTTFSLRTRESANVNLTEFAARIGKQFNGSGGGHRAASGIQLPGRYDHIPGSEQFVTDPLVFWNIGLFLIWVGLCMLTFTASKRVQDFDTRIHTWLGLALFGLSLLWTNRRLLIRKWKRMVRQLRLTKLHQS